MPRDERDADGGFTLVELAVTMVIMTVVLGALTMGVVTLLRTTGVTTDRLVGSHDAQLLTEWITTDIQSAASAPNLVTTTQPGCSDDPASGVNVAQMTWTDRSTGVVYHSAYRTEQISAGPPQIWQLVRYFCQEGQPSTHFPVVRGLKDGSVCSGGTPGTTAACVLTPAWPRFDLQIVSVAGNESYTFTATATGRTATAGIDTAAPQVTCIDPPPAPCVKSIVAYNTDSSGFAGPINRVVVTFDELLKPVDPAPVGQWTLNSAPNGATITKVAIANHSVTLTLSASGSPIATTTAGFTIDLLPDPNGVSDGAGNPASFIGQPVSDRMAPILVSANTLDNNGDAKIDHLNLTVSEPIDNNTLDVNLFTVTSPPAWGGIPVTVIAALKIGPTTVTLVLNDASFPQDTAATGFTVAMAASPNGVRDIATPTIHNFGAWPATTVGDGVPPELVSLLSHDTDLNGALDQIVATFSEPLQPSADTSQWTFSQPTGWAGRPSVGAVSVSGTQVTLDIKPQLIGSGSPPVPFDTAAANLKATTLAPSATGIRDAAGNQASASNVPVTDGMNPVLRDVKLLFLPGATPGYFENGDSLLATFTEPLTVSDTTTRTVTLTQPPGGSTAKVNIPGLTNGAVTIPTTYFNAAGGTAQWSANVVRSGNTISVTLTSVCTGPDCANLVPGNTVGMHLDLSPDLHDAVGLLALDTTLNIRWF